MRSFVFGAAMGAIAMYFYLQGFDPIIAIADAWWTRISSPHALALQQ